MRYSRWSVLHTTPAACTYYPSRIRSLQAAKGFTVHSPTAQAFYLGYISPQKAKGKKIKKKMHSQNVQKRHFIRLNTSQHNNRQQNANNF
jgi:hypothetical protein